MIYLNVPKLYCSEQLQYLHQLEANPGTSIRESSRHEANILLAHSRQLCYITP